MCNCILQRHIQKGTRETRRVPNAVTLFSCACKHASGDQSLDDQNRNVPSNDDVAKYSPEDGANLKEYNNSLHTIIDEVNQTNASWRGVTHGQSSWGQCRVLASTRVCVRACVFRSTRPHHCMFTSCVAKQTGHTALGVSHKTCAQKLTVLVKPAQNEQAMCIQSCADADPKCCSCCRHCLQARDRFQKHMSTKVKPRLTDLRSCSPTYG